MDTKDILYNLRAKKGLSQDELAEKVFVTRQAVSRWENGETTPNVETVVLLSHKKSAIYAVCTLKPYFASMYSLIIL